MAKDKLHPRHTLAHNNNNITTYLPIHIVRLYIVRPEVDTYYLCTYLDILSAAAVANAAWSYLISNTSYIRNVKLYKFSHRNSINSKIDWQKHDLNHPQQRIGSPHSISIWLQVRNDIFVYIKWYVTSLEDCVHRLVLTGYDMIYYYLLPII